MEVKHNEILLIYNSSDVQEKKAHGYFQGLSDLALKVLDLKYDQLTERQIIEIADKLGVSLEEMIDPGEISEEKIAQDDIPRYLANDLPKLRTPIALYHNRAEFVESPYHFVNKDMQSK